MNAVALSDHSQHLDTNTTDQNSRDGHVVHVIQDLELGTCVSERRLKSWPIGKHTGRKKR